MNLDLDIDEVLTTTRAVRRRLDLERPVSREVVEECLRLAFQAPNGANEQDWVWVLVDDPETRRAMADLYRAGHAEHRRLHAGSRPSSPPPDSPERIDRRHRSVQHLSDHLEQVPVLVVPGIGVRYGQSTTFQQASLWGSILPAVWSFVLALRSRGLGSAWTTLHLYREREMGELLGIPESYVQAGLFPVAHTVGTSFRPAPRDKAEERIFWNRFTR